jgi:hypothetical protein
VVQFRNKNTGNLKVKEAKNETNIFHKGDKTGGSLEMGDIFGKLCMVFNI